ncbi:hypothetical protein, partial [Acidovorax sp. SUPP3334]|uniref:hypothetical protein n=1 Tax=Acidovorax sp. SUPP3334 TaxID=2920881 RepID=UPI0024E09D5C
LALVLQDHLHRPFPDLRGELACSAHGSIFSSNGASGIHGAVHTRLGFCSEQLNLHFGFFEGVFIPFFEANAWCASTESQLLSMQSAAC